MNLWVIQARRRGTNEWRVYMPYHIYVGLGNAQRRLTKMQGWHGQEFRLVLYTPSEEVIR